MEKTECENCNIYSFGKHITHYFAAVASWHAGAQHSVIYDC